MVTSNTTNKNDEGELEQTTGLSEGHAYSLLKLEEIILNDNDTVKLVKIRNPWGQHEWKRDWSDESEKWDNVSDSEKVRIGYTNKDDGGFWMSFHDWTDQFEKFSICILPSLYV